MDIFTETYLSIINEEQQKTQWYCQTCDQYFPSQRQLIKHKSIHPHKCKFCGKIFENPSQLGIHLTWCKENPDYEKYEKKRKEGRENKHYKHSQETKQKISQRRKQYIDAHPQSTYWNQKGSFISKPCEELKKFLTDNGINFYPEYQCREKLGGRGFSIDIAFPNQKIAIEVNGNQHYNNEGNLGTYYKERHDLLENLGWTVYEIPFKKTYDKEVRQKLLQAIKQNVKVNFDYSEEIKRKREEKEARVTCPICGGKKSEVAELCAKCQRQKRKENFPSKQQLIKDKEELHSWIAIGKKYNVSDNAVRRWFRNYNLI